MVLRRQKAGAASQGSTGLGGFPGEEGFQPLP